MISQLFHIAHALTQRVCPVRNFDSKRILDIRFIKDRKNRTLYRAGEFVTMTRLDVTIGITSYFSNHLSKVIPRAYDFIRVVIYSGISLKLTILNNIKDSYCQIICISWCSNLIEDYFQLRFGCCQIQHGFHEVLTEFAIRPCCAED